MKRLLKITYLTSSLILVFSLFLSQESVAQADRKLIRKGNKEYEKGNYKEAEIDYRKALEKNSESTKAKYNLAATAYKQKNTEEAAKLLEQVNPGQLPGRDKAKLYHNLGNSYLQAKKYKESIQAYKQSLKFNPNDADTRYNLAYAMKKLQAQQQQQQQQKQGGGQNKDQKNQQKKDQQQQQNDQQQQKQQQQKQQISKEDAERMMEAMKNNEKNTLDKLNKKKAQAVRVKIEKDW